MTDADSVNFDEEPPPARRASSSPTTEAESHVIACCLLDEGETLDRAISRGLSPDSFHDPALATLFGRLSRMRAEQTPITLEALVSEMGPRLNEIGGFPLIFQIQKGVPTTAHAGHFIAKVQEAASVRAWIRYTKQVQEHIERGGATADLPPQPTDSKPSDWKTRRVKLMAPPAEPETRLFLAGKPVCTPGNLTTLISRAKTGKTATIGGAVAAIIAAHHDRSGLDTLGFSAPHTDEAVVLIDTEQSPYDAWTCHSRAMARAQQEDDPKWLLHYALVGYSAKQLRDALPTILASAKAQHKGVFTLILDGVADFVASVNDEAECNEFIAYLRTLSVDYNCPIICVIHSNEALKSGDDGRGHLGKQLTRKAESNLLLKKEGDVTTITSEKQRKAPITTQDGIAFQWSDEQQRHVSCTPIEGPDMRKPGRAVTFQFETFAQIFPKKHEKPKTRQALYRFATELASIKETAFREVLQRAVETGELERLPDGAGYSYRLTI